MKHLNLILTLFLFVIFTANITGQAEKNIRLIEENSWLERVEPNVTVNDFFQKKYVDFGLEKAADMQSTQTTEGKNGLKHFKFQQFYKGLKVLGGEYILHEQNGILKNANGKIFPNIDVNIQSVISEAGFVSLIQDHAYKIALKENRGEHPKDFRFEQLKIETIETAIVDKAFPKTSGEYALASVLDVEYPDFPPRRDRYLIDAKTGKVLLVIPQICHTEVEGQVKTRYSGDQKMTVDSVAPNRFLTQDFTRGTGIVTINDLTGAPFEDEDNVWDNVNDDQDEAAGDAHYGAISFYDYMLNKFNWDGLDNQGMGLTSIVHTNKGESYVNAFWNGSTANFGDGNCGDYGPLTTLDVVGHEFAHGVTEFSSGLIYSSESGGLNEGMSDVFGKALEYYFCTPGTFTWDVGGAFITGQDVEPFRSMKNPNLYENPKYYRGEFWDFDNERVHNTSGVFGHWFYLLVDGEKGTNEAGIDYDVQPIGMDKTMEIVFAVETEYLTPSSNYSEAAVASLRVAEAIFGTNSSEVASVEEAWKAVGVTDRPVGDLDNDLEIILLNDEPLVCDLDEQISIRFQVKNTGSNVAKAGTQLRVKYLMRDIFDDLVNEFVESFELTTDLETEAFEAFEFSTKVKGDDFKNDLYPNIQVLFDDSYSDDFDVNNTSSVLELEMADSEGVDLSFFVFVESEKTCSPEQIEVRVSMRNRGCETVPAGTPFRLFYQVQNQDYEINGTLPIDLSTNRGYQHYEVFTLDISLPLSDVFATLEMAGDFYTDDDNLNRPETILPGFSEDFTNFPAFFGSDEIYLDGFTADDIQYQGNDVLGFTGFFDEPFPVVSKNCDDLQKKFDDLQEYGSTLQLCVDATGFLNPYLSFELIQFVSDSTGGFYDKEEGAQVRVRFDEGADVDPVIIVGQPEGVKVFHEIQLPSDYVGNISMDMITLQNGAFGLATGDFSQHDFLILDNLVFGDGLVNTTPVHQTNAFEVYPNPANDVIWFENKSADSGAYDVEIYNAVGSLIGNLRGVKGIGQFDVSRFVSGIYFYKIDLKNGSFLTGKVLKE